MAKVCRSLLTALCLMGGVSYGATVTLEDGGSIRIACDGGQAPIMAADSAGEWLIWPPSAYDTAQTDLTAYNVATKEQVSVPMRTPDVMHSAYRTTFAVSADRKEIFYYGWNRSWNSYFTKFYLVDFAGALQ